VRPLRAGSDPREASSSRFEGGRVLNDSLPAITPDTPNGQSFARLKVRHDDVHDAEDDACGEQDEFDGHARQYTFSRVYVADGSTTAVTTLKRDFRIVPESGYSQRSLACLKRANSGFHATAATELSGTSNE
jgi:hypothetical protein